MAYPPNIRTEAFDLYLLGNSPSDIAKELKRRYPDGDMPSAKTVEQWAYVPHDGKTWSELRYEAEQVAKHESVRNFVTARQKTIEGLVKLNSRLAERALQAADEGELGPAAQEAYAAINCGKSVANLLRDDLAAEARQHDAVDMLVEAIRRMIPDYETQYAEKVQQEFRRLIGRRGDGTKTE